MRFLSLFSGIEAASTAWVPLGWECVAVAEIEPFPCKVLAHHHSDVPNLGDVTKVTREQIKALGRIDLVVFGSPCQDLSIAGKRRGFQGERSGLFTTAIRIVRWARQHCDCRFALWENVFGAFSSHQGRDFAVVVEQMAGCEDVAVPVNGWGAEGAALGDLGLLEWCVLDAQWFGVAQRRRRVFALADFGDWSNRPPILLEPESLRGDFAPRREAGKAVAALTSTGVGTCGADDNQAQAGHLLPVTGKQWPADVASTLDAHYGDKWGLEDQHVFGGAALFVPAAQSVALRGRDGGATADLGDGVANALRCGGGGGGGDKPHVLAPVAFQSSQSGVRLSETHATLDANNGSRRHNGVITPVCITGEVTHTLKADGFDGSEDGTGRGNPIVAVQLSGGTNGELVNRACESEGDMSARAVRNMCEPRCRSASQERGLARPLAIQPSALVPELPHQGTSEREDVHDLRQATQGPRILRHALPAIQEMGRPDAGEGQPIYGTEKGFREESGQDMQGSELRREISCEGILLKACDARKAGAVGTNIDNEKRGNAEGVGYAQTYSVRRLTPRECERLMGQKDDFTRIPVKMAKRRSSKFEYIEINGELWQVAADGPRYKSLGNSMAVTCMVWIGTKINAALLAEVAA